MKIIPTACISILLTFASACSPEDNAAITQGDALTTYKDGTRAYVDAASGMSYEILEKKNGNPNYVTHGVAKIWIKLTNPNGSTDYKMDGDSEYRFLYGMSKTFPGLSHAILFTPIGEKRRWRMQREAVGFLAATPMKGWYELEIKVFGNVDEPKKPEDLTNPPPDAITTKTGLRYRVIQEGEDKGKRPNIDSLALVHYNGWASNGELFDSSLIRDEPVEFPLKAINDGLKEGIQLMHTGATYRFWIPSELAYGDSDDSVGPRGALVFDVALVSFKSE